MSVTAANVQHETRREKAMTWLRSRPWLRAAHERITLDVIPFTADKRLDKEERQEEIVQHSETELLRSAAPAAGGVKSIPLDDTGFSISMPTKHYQSIRESATTPFSMDDFEKATNYHKGESKIHKWLKSLRKKSLYSAKAWLGLTGIDAGLTSVLHIGAGELLLITGSCALVSYWIYYASSLLIEREKSKERAAKQQAYQTWFTNQMWLRRYDIPYLG